MSLFERHTWRPGWRIGLTAVLAGLLSASWGAIPLNAAAVGPVARYGLEPNPIAPPASLTPNTTITLTLTAEDSANSPVPGATVFLSFLQTTNGGTASVGGTALTSTPQAVTANSSGQIAIAYASSASTPTGGQDTIRAWNAATNPTIRAADNYQYSLVSHYVFSPSPIAPGATLAASQTTPVTVQAQKDDGSAVPGATIYLSLTPTAGGGSASVGATSLTTTPRAFVSDGSGQITISYTTPSTLSGTGTDTIRAQDATRNPGVVVRDNYTYTPLQGMYTLDAYGGVHPDGGSASLGQGAYWPGWKIARSVVLLPDASGGYVLDGFGGLHPFGSASPVTGASYWPGFDIARDVVLLPTSTPSAPSGYTLDGWGGIHSFGDAPAVVGTGYWPGWDIAKRLVLMTDDTPASDGYVLDGWGGLHPFAALGQPRPPVVATAYWPGFNIARDVVLTPGITDQDVSGVTLDGYGGVHPFGNAGPAQGFSYWPGWNIARAIRLAPDSIAASPKGWVLDGRGGLHPFGGAPAITNFAYWPTLDLAVQLAVQ